MNYLAVRPRLARRLGKAARQVAERRWKLERYLDRLEKIYQELLEGR
jgi:glycosyltransferase involved in cell wall biosynthesis